MNETKLKLVALRLQGWKDIQKEKPPSHVLIEVRIRHASDKGDKDEIVRGWMGDDNFYFEDGGELSFNWNIIEWRS